jgi:hypothetical protein
MRTSALQEINGSIMHERDQGSKRKKWSGRVFHARTRKPRRRGVAESGRTCRLHAAAPYPVGEGVQSFDNEARKAKRRLLSLRQRAKCSKSAQAVGLGLGLMGRKPLYAVGTNHGLGPRDYQRHCAALLPVKQNARAILNSSK